MSEIEQQQPAGAEEFWKTACAARSPDGFRMCILRADQPHSHEWADPQERGGAIGDIDYAACNATCDRMDAEIDRLTAQLAERDATIEDLSVRLTQAEMAVTNDWSYLDRVYDVVEAAETLVLNLTNPRLTLNGRTITRSRLKLRAALDQAHRPHHAVDAHTEGTGRLEPPSEPPKPSVGSAPASEAV